MANRWMFWPFIFSKGIHFVWSHQLVRKIPVQQFFDGEQDDGALFFFPKARDFPLGVLAVIERHEKAFLAFLAHHHGFKAVNVWATDFVFLFLGSGAL
jgi:hypothetical protein